MYSKSLEDYEEISALRAVELSPLSAEEMRVIDGLHRENVRNERSSFTFRIITTVIWLGIIIFFICFGVKYEIWTDGSLTEMLCGAAVMIFLSVLEVKNTVRLINIGARKLKILKFHAGFKGIVLQKKTEHRNLEFGGALLNWYNYTVVVGVGEKLMVGEVACTKTTYYSLEPGDKILVLYYKDGTKIGCQFS